MEDPAIFSQILECLIRLSSRGNHLGSFRFVEQVLTLIFENSYETHVSADQRGSTRVVFLVFGGVPGVVFASFVSWKLSRKDAHEGLLQLQPTLSCHTVRSLIRHARHRSVASGSFVGHRRTARILDMGQVVIGSAFQSRWMDKVCRLIRDGRVFAVQRHV